MLSQQAGEGLEDLAHGAVADDDDALTLEALGEVRGIHRVQVARVWLEDLAEFLHRRVEGLCSAPLCLVENADGDGCLNGLTGATPASGSHRASKPTAAEQTHQ